jgi:hypothetical protein
MPITELSIPFLVLAIFAGALVSAFQSSAERFYVRAAPFIVVIFDVAFGGWWAAAFIPLDLAVMYSAHSFKRSPLVVAWLFSLAINVVLVFGRLARVVASADDLLPGSEWIIPLTGALFLTAGRVAMVMFPVMERIGPPPEA